MRSLKAEESQKLVAVDFDPFAQAELAATAPSTEGQREIWAAAQMGDDASAAFNESISLTFHGALDETAFRTAVSDLVARHEALRTTLSPDGLTLCIAAQLELHVPVVDLSQLDERERNARVRSILTQEVQLPFQLEYGPLFRVQLVKLGANEHLATFSGHHIVCDGWSMAVMLRDLGALYTARVKGVTAELAPAHPFSAYARAERELELSPEYRSSEAYWLEKLAGSLPTLDLPLDGPRPPSKTYTSIREDYTLDAELVERVKKLGAKNGSSFFNTLLAGFYSLLARLSGEQDIVVGIPAAGQSVTGQPNLVGHCVNTLPLRVQVEDTAKISVFLRAVRATMLDAYEHQRCTFGGLLKKLSIPRDPSRLPLVSVLFNVDQAVNGDDLKFEGLRVGYRSNPRSFENFEIFINAAETRGKVVLECQFNADLFDQETIRRWLAAYEQLLRGLCEGEDRPMGEITILPPSERAKLVYEWNATFADYARDVPAHALLEAQAKRTPDATAIISGKQSISYADLDRRSTQLAQRLRRMGVRKEVLVGLCTNRSIEMVVGLFGILKAGGAYVPLDPNFPRDRIAYMIEDSKLRVLVSETDLARELELKAPELLFLDQERAALAAESTEPLKPSADDAGPESLAYVIYTSGSTGKPKGVCVPHMGVVNFLASMAREPGCTQEDVLLAVTTLSFDIAVLELYLPLMVGARIVLASREMAVDGGQLRQAIERHGVTIMQATPSTWRLLLAAGFTGQQRIKMLCGGEALPRDLASELARYASSLWNMYGPTETTVWSTCHRIMEGGRVLVGKPIANTTLYVLDKQLQPVPIGVPGELHIGGDGVTRGYLHRPELTSERFITDPFLGDPNARIYKTGDVVRYLADGNVEYLRRNDNQIKLRGYRIELGEVETAIASTPGVKQAVALIREMRPGDSRLVGYVIAEPGKDPSDADIKAHMRRAMPEYMLPQHIVRLQTFPLTPNGKIDRKALPTPVLDGAAEKEFVAPRNEKEALIAAVFRELLGARAVSVTDNFFDIGGHSVLAAQVLSRLQRDHGILIPLRKLFEAPSAAGLAALIPDGKDPAQASEIERIPRRDESKPAPLSVMQQRLWILEQLDPGLAVQNLPSAFRIRGAFDAVAFERAVQEVVRRHEVTRTVLQVENGDAVQLVKPELSVSLLPMVDLSSVPPAARETRLIELLRAEAAKAFELTRGPLFTSKLYKLSPEEHVFFWMPHHAIWDGWSFDVFLNELDQLYGAFARGMPSPLPELPIRYQDFAAWHRDYLKGPELALQATYWREQLKDPPLLELPTDRPRPARLSYRGATESFTLSKAEVDALTALGRRADATLYMVLLAAFKTLLSRYAGQDDIVIGTPIRGRSMPETENLLGFFVNTLVFRTDLSGNPSFLDLLARVRKVALDAYAHQDMPFEQLVQELNVPRDTSRTPIFQAFFTYQDVSNRAPRFGDLSYSQIHVHALVTMTDVYLWVKETGNGLAGGIDYATDLFDQATIARFVKQLRQLLVSVCEDATRSVRHVSILPESERRAILAVNETQATYPSTLGVHQLFEQQAKAHPARIAVICGEEQLTYATLDQRASALAQKLRELGVAPDALVGLYMERSPVMLVGLLAILKAGGAYVPLDPGFPRDRLDFMVEDAGLSCVITQRSLVSEIPGGGRARVLLADDIEPSEKSLEPGFASNGSAAAYVIYTSGSTGKPKGVVVPHQAVVNYLASVRKAPGLGESDAILALTTLSFDIAVTELWLPLSVGARIILASREDAVDGERLLGLIRKHQVKVAQATPVTWRLLLGAGLAKQELDRALVGGEALPLDLAQELANRVDTVWNMYGPTETTVWSTAFALRAPVERVLIGRPLDNQAVYVVDAAGELCPLGVPGELLIGGDGVTRGYHERPELTNERFHADPFRAGGRVYRTGDVVRLRADGNLEYLRRNDNQVKVRGYRIELGEVEASLTTAPGVRQAVALVREFGPGDSRLVAYVVPEASATPSDADLKAHLRAALPEYMVPSHFVKLDVLPLTPNGKIDRKALSALSLESQAVQADFVTPRDETETTIAAVMQTLLGGRPVSVHDNFFELGGHSVLAAQMLSRLQREHGIALPLRKIFESPTVAALAAFVAEAKRGGTATSLERIARRADGTPPVPSSMQQRLFFLEQLEPDLAVYNLPFTIRIHGKLDEQAFERALQEIVLRHEAIRSVFHSQAAELFLKIDDQRSISLLPATDLSQRAAAEREQQLLDELGARAARPFDLTRGPLFDAGLYRLGAEDHVFFWMAHHAVWDGWSFSVFLDELDQLYAAFSRGQPSPLPALPIRYQDFSAWHHGWLKSSEIARQAAYWRDQLRGPLPVLGLHTDRPRPPRFSYRGETVPFSLSKAEVDALLALGRRADATLYMVLLAAFEVLLARYTGQEDIVVGTPIRGRNHAEIENLLGFFVNTLVLRTDLSGAPSFLDLLKRVRQVALGAYANQDMPFDQLVRELETDRDMSRTPVYQAFFAFQDTSQRASKLGDLSYSHVQIDVPVAMTDLDVWLRDTGDGLVGGITFASDLFERETIERFSSQLRQLLASVCQDATRSVSHLNILPETERRAILAVNQTAAAYPRELGLHQLFERQAQAHPERVAAVFGREQLSYGELNRRACVLAKRLRELGVKRDALVGLYMERSPAMLVGLLGILKAGGAYVPLDPAFPRERLEFMVADAAMGCIVSERSLESDLPAHQARVLLVDDLPDEEESTASEPSSGDAAAYVIYTSGSTGKPKGVVVPHRAVVNYLSSVAASPGLSEQDRVLAITTLSFDIAVTELWLPLSVGARIVLASREDGADGERLLEIIRRNEVNVAQATPVTWRLLLAAGIRENELQKALVGGEAVPLDLAQALAAKIPTVWNMYGPTETTVWSTSYAMRAPVERVLIGRPLHNQSIYVVDRAGELCPLGVPGELLIGGDGVTRGYHNRPELTSERFHADPFVPGARVYRTGDIVRLLPNGNLEYQRRNDHQIKVRGYRIETGEIENTLERHAAVKQAVVMAREDQPGDVRLVAYLTKSDDVTDSELRAHLRESLPEYMLPQHFVELSEFPLTPNGKVDRKALPSPTQSAQPEAEFVEPETETERVLAQIWRDALGISKVSAHDNFFNLGGHSLLALKVTSEVERRLGTKLNPRSLLRDSLQQIAAQIAPATQQVIRSSPTGSRQAPAQDKPLIGRLFQKVRSKLRGD